MEAIELVRRGSPSDADAELFACAKCGHVYSPRIYACGIKEGLVHARRAAEDCALCRSRETTHEDHQRDESAAHDRRVAAATRVTDLDACFSPDGDTIYGNPEEAAAAGETGVFGAIFTPFRLDAGAVIEAMLEQHGEAGDVDALRGVDDLHIAIDTFNRAQDGGSYTMDTKRWQDVPQNRTFAMIKPDATMRGVEADMLADIEAAGFRIVSQERRVLDVEEAEWLYREHARRDHYRDLVAYTVSAEVVLLVLESDHDDTPTAFRALMGPTDRAKAEPHTLRAKYAIGLRENSIHGSDSPASAVDEIARLGPDQ